MEKIAKQLYGSFQKPSQKEIRKWLPEIFKHIKTADILEIQIDSGIFEMPNQKTLWLETGYDGNSTVTFRLYHKDRDKRAEVIKRATSEKRF